MFEKLQIGEKKSTMHQDSLVYYISFLCLTAFSKNRTLVQSTLGYHNPPNAVGASMSEILVCVELLS